MCTCVSDWEGYWGDIFSSGVGVMQGCPLSPLFLVFFYRVEAFMHEMLPGVHLGMHLGQMLLQILYAYDLVLLAESEVDLQKMLIALQKKCSSTAFVS